MFDRLNKLIAKNKLKKVINVLVEEMPTKDKELKSEIFKISGRFYKWQNEKSAAKNSKSMLDQTYNQIQESLLNLIELLKEDNLEEGLSEINKVSLLHKRQKQQKKELIDQERDDIVKWLKKDVKQITTIITGKILLKIPKIKKYEETFEFELWNAIILLSGALRVQDKTRLSDPSIVFDNEEVSALQYVDALEILIELIPEEQFVQASVRERALLFIRYFQDRIKKYYS